ncbi:NAD-dependent epimerase/dehydratase family protein [Edaphobacter modestus]|uniref:Nucleoside-diphosphate-sugar epimerase n=1 Tax=Edaphobacter modestus TaxID=388466 RepID=A0A4Q7YPU5_9BACT|nr:NAD-dependent epimerase/dehydratase family protein [Edaphobacter modestus]RZU38851.1 nucleoside-diphosphate-sugar epimerase [Edaphobacter modestus]
MENKWDVNKPKPRLFLTGGSGYVGRNLVRHFIAKDFEVVALARSERSLQIVKALGAVPFAGDLLDAGLVEGMKGCQTLINAAADTDHGRGTAQQSHTNLEGTRKLFQSALTAGISRAVHISTESVLLDGGPLINATEDHPFPHRPAGSYSHTKGEAERIARSFSTQGLAVVVVRPRFIWGRDDTKGLPQIAAAAKAGKLAWIEGGHYLSSTTHIANVCEGVSLALDKGRSGEVYFVTDGAPIPFRSFITSMLETQGIVAPTKSVPRWIMRGTATIGDFLDELSGGRIKPLISRQVLATIGFEVTLDTTKARDQLGYHPVITMDEGMSELKSHAWGGNRQST